MISKRVKGEVGWIPVVVSSLEDTLVSSSCQARDTLSKKRVEETDAMLRIILGVDHRYHGHRI